jgi:hypothetical protein
MATQLSKNFIIRHLAIKSPGHRSGKILKPSTVEVVNVGSSLLETCSIIPPDKEWDVSVPKVTKDGMVDFGKRT